MHLERQLPQPKLSRAHTQHRPAHNHAPAALSCASKLSSFTSEAENELPTSRKVGSPPVSSALRRLMVMVGVSATKRSVVAASPWGGGAIACGGGLGGAESSVCGAQNRETKNSCEPTTKPTTAPFPHALRHSREAHRITNERHRAREEPRIRLGLRPILAYKVKPQSVNDQQDSFAVWCCRCCCRGCFW